MPFVFSSKTAVGTPMGVPSKMARVQPRPPFVSAGEKLAQMLEKTNGSLAEVTNGTVIRVGGSDKPWDMATQWNGREITEYSKRYSTWTKAWLVAFNCPLSSGGKLTQFTLTLDKDLPPEEVDRSAETYMMLLNLRRQE